MDLGNLKAKAQLFIESKSFLGLVIVFGLLNGPVFLQTGRDSQPPLDWLAIGVIFVFGVVAMTFVIGLQILLNKPQSVRFLWKIFYFQVIFIGAAGISALLTAVIQNDFGPHSLLGLAMAGGLAIGLYLTKPFEPKT